MSDRHKTRKQLLAEVEALRAEVAALKQAASSSPEKELDSPSTQAFTLQQANVELQRNRQLRQELLEHQRLEQSLQASEAKLNDILNRAIASITSFRVYANRGWEYEYQSTGSEVLFGYTPEEILTDKLLWMSQVHPEDRETTIMPLFEDLFAERTKTVEFRFQHKDGSIRWISATYSSHYNK